MDWATGTWLLLGFSLGLVHAFDADHVMTLSVYSSRADERGGEGIRLGLQWALGHGLMLLVVGAALLALGHSMPDAWFIFAERGVACVMIVLGLKAGYELLSQRGHIHFHTHDDLAPHAHWHSHSDSRADGARSLDDEKAGHDPAHRHEHGPLLVGGLHGLAGSAAVLAVLPSAGQSVWAGLLYLVVFAVGVALAMATVSGLLGEMARRLAQPSHPAHRLGWLRAGSAMGSIGIGVWMLAFV